MADWLDDPELYKPAKAPKSGGEDWLDDPALYAPAPEGFFDSVKRRTGELRAKPLGQLITDIPGDSAAAGESLVRGVGSGLNRIGGTAALIGGMPLASLGDLLTGGDRMTDAVGGYVDSSFRNADALVANDPRAKNPENQVASALGSVAPDLLMAYLTGGESAAVQPLVQQSVRQGVARAAEQMIEQGAKASVVPSLARGSEMGTDVIQAGGTVPEALGAFGTGAAANSLAYMVPGAASGSLPVRAVEGALVEPAAGYLQNEAENLSLPNRLGLDQAYDARSAFMDVFLGGGLAAGMGGRPQERLADPEAMRTPEDIASAEIETALDEETFAARPAAPTEGAGYRTTPTGALEIDVPIAAGPAPVAAPATEATPKAKYKTPDGIDVELRATPKKDYGDGAWDQEIKAYVGDNEVGSMYYSGGDASPQMDVAPEMQRKGIASAMIQLAKRQGADLGDDVTGKGAGFKSVRTEMGQATRQAAKKVALEIDGEPAPELPAAERLYSDYSPDASQTVTRKDGNLSFPESRLTRRALDDALETAAADPVAGTERLLTNIAEQPDIRDEQKWLAEKLAPLMRDLGVKLVAPNPDLPYAGAYNNVDNTVWARQADPETVLHETFHGATSALITSKAARANPVVKKAVTELDDMLGHLTGGIGLGDIDTRNVHPEIRRLLDDKQGPLSNTKEFVTYGMTNRPFQDFLKSLPPPPGREKARNMWEYFKSVVTSMFGAKTDAQRSFLDALIETGGDLVEFAAANPKEVKVAQVAEAGKLGRVDAPPVVAAKPPAPPATPVAPKPSEPAPKRPDTTLKNESVAAEREARKEEPVEKDAPQSNDTTLDKAKAELKKNPDAAQEIIERMATDPQGAVSVTEQAVLLVESERVRAEREKAEERAADLSLTPEQRAVALRKVEELNAAVTALDQATTNVGTIGGRLLQFRQRALKEDFTLAALERKAIAVKGAPLTVDERAELKDLARRFKEKEAEFAALQEKLADRATNQDVAATYRKLLEDLQKPRKPDVAALRKKAEAARKALLEMAGTDAAVMRGADQTKTPAFKRWFGDSKVVDADGKPLVVYHGTAGEFNAFDKDAAASHIPLPGFFFTPDAAIAEQFADGAAHRRKVSGAQPRIVDAYISMQNPARLDYTDRASGKMTSERIVRSDLADARRAGHDGAIITGWADGSGDVQYVAFRSTQIKSATGNSGAFDPSNPAIDAATLSPEQALIDIGAFHYASGATSKADWLKAMLEDVPEKFRKGLDDLFELSKAGASRPVMDGPLTHKQVYDLAMAEVKSGVKGEEAVMKAVTAAVKAVHPEMTERDVRRLFSEYGKATFPSKDADKTALRELRALVQMQESIDRLEEGLPKLKSGPQREKATAIVLEKRAALNALLKAGQKKVVGDAEKLAMYQQARAENLRKQIELIDRQVMTGERAGPRTAKPMTPEIERLSRLRDQLRAEREAIDNPPKSEQQVREEARIRALEANIQRIRDSLSGKPVEPGKPPVSSEQIKSLEKLRDELREQLDAANKAKNPSMSEAEKQQRRIESGLRRKIKNVEELLLFGKKPKPTPVEKGEAALLLEKALEAFTDIRDAINLRDNPPLTADQRYQKARGNAIKRQIEKLRARIAAGDYEKAVRVPKELNDANTKAAFELEKIKEQFMRFQFEQEMAKRSKLRKILGGAQETLNLARAIMTSFDLSAVLRQGGFISLGNPVRAAKGIAPMLKAFASKEGEFKVRHDIETRPNAKLYKAAGLELTDIGSGLNLSKMEEAFMSRWIEKIPKAAGGGFLRGSQRAFTTFLNKLRADSFDAMLASLARNGAQPSMAEAKAIASYINVATGRGKIGMSASAATGLNTVFFAPKLVASRFNLLAGQPLYGGTVRTRTMIAAEYARFLTGVSVVMGLGALAHDDEDDDKPFVNFDPRTSDFGKMRFGKTFIDPLAGLAQVTTFLAREISGESVTGKGEVVPLRNQYRLTLQGDEKVEYGSQNAYDVATRFVRTKLAPIPGAIVNAFTGEDVVGNEATPGSIVTSLVVPLSMQNVKDVMTDHGVPAGTAITMLELLGMGVQHRDPAQLKAPDYNSMSREEKDVYGAYVREADKIKAAKQSLQDFANGLPPETAPADMRYEVEKKAAELGLEGATVDVYKRNTTARDDETGQRMRGVKRTESGNVKMNYKEAWSLKGYSAAEKSVSELDGYIEELDDDNITNADANRIWGKFVFSEPLTTDAPDATVSGKKKDELLNVLRMQRKLSQSGFVEEQK